MKSLVFFVMAYLFSGMFVISPVFGEFIDVEISESNVSGSFTISLNERIGQEFSPSYSQHIAVELLLREVNLSTPEEPVTVRLISPNTDDVLDAGDTIIATSQSVIPVISDSVSWVRFDFHEPVSLIPNEIYVIEAVTTTDHWAWSRSDNIISANTYISSIRLEDYADDLIFRTIVVPEPGTILLLGFGGLALRRKMRR